MFALIDGIAKDMDILYTQDGAIFHDYLHLFPPYAGRKSIRMSWEWNPDEKAPPPAYTLSCTPLPLEQPRINELDGQGLEPRGQLKFFKSSKSP